MLPAKPRSSGLKATALQDAAAASPLDPNGSAVKLPTAPLPAPVHAAPETGTQGHFYFHDSDGEEKSGGRPRASAGAVVLPNTYTAAISQAPEPRVSQLSVEHAELPLPPPPPRRHAAVTPQPAAAAEQRAPAPRASTLAEVYAARGRASAANMGANGSGRPPSNPPMSRQDGDNCVTWVYSVGESSVNPVSAAKRRHVRAPQHHSEALPLLKRRPIGGDVIAYKLLEIGGDFTPQVSEYRLGKVSVFEPEGGSMRLVPWPDHTLHPVLAEQALADGYDYYEEPASDDEDAEEGEQLWEPVYGPYSHSLTEESTSSCHVIEVGLITFIREVCDGQKVLIVNSSVVTLCSSNDRLYILCSAFISSCNSSCVVVLISHDRCVASIDIEHAPHYIA